MNPWYKSPTTIALIISALGGLASLVGQKLDPLQIETLTTFLQNLGEAITILGPIVAGIYHHISKKKAQEALTIAVSQNAPAATDSPQPASNTR